MQRFNASSLTTHVLVTAACLVASSNIAAQQVMKIVGPDGRITYSDRAANVDQSKATPTSVSAGGEQSTPLPYEIKQIASRFPVVLYTGKNCDPCEAGRQLLKERGVPFTEKTVNTNEDIAALERLNASSTLPVITIGQQRLTGFSSSEWIAVIDAAGYPAKSQLPSSYKPAAPVALAPVAKKPAPDTANNDQAESSKTTEKAPPRRRAAQQPSGDAPVNRVTPNNPAGIQF